MNVRKTVVITGATSAIGVSLIQNYIDKSDSNIIAIIRPNSKNIKRLDCYKLKIIECDLSDLSTLMNDKIKCDIFYHLAWEGTTKEARMDEDIQFKNVNYSIQAVKLAQKWNAKVFVGAGSQAEYGNVEGIIDEETPVNPNTFYGIAKYSACKFIECFCQKNNINYRWGRIFSAYGLYDNSHTLIMSLVNGFITGKKIELTKCEQMWNYINYFDVGSAFYQIGLADVNGLFCIAGEESKPLKEYIDLILKVTHNKIKLDIGALPYTANQVMNLRVNTSKLYKLIGFEQVVKFEDGIRELICKENINSICGMEDKI